MPATPASAHAPTADTAFVSYRIPSAGAYPMGLAQAPDGSVWFVESFLGKLGKLTNGSISEINVPGSDALLGHIAIDRAGNVWADYANRGESRGGVLRLDASGNVTEFAAAPVSPGAFPAIGGLTLGPDGNLWFSEGDAGGATIGRIDQSGRVAQFAVHESPGSSGPLGIVSGPDGNLWYGDAARIGRVSRGGAELAGFDVRVPAVDLAVDRKRKTVWFDDAYSNVGRIDASGTLHVYAEGSNASGTFVPDGPVGIAVDARGTVWVGELNFGTVGALGPSGTMQHYRPPSGSTPWGVLPQGGVLYFTDFGGDQLYRLDPAVYSAEGLPLSD